MPICRRQTFKTVRLRFVISRLGWSYYPLYPAICGENPGPPDWPFWLCAGIRGTPRRLCPWHELSRFPKTVRHPCRAATVRERFLNAWPANAPLRSRLGWGFTFVPFYVGHPFGIRSLSAAEPGIGEALPPPATYPRGWRGSIEGRNKGARVWKERGRASGGGLIRSEEHTSELQSRQYL